MENNRHLITLVNGESYSVESDNVLSALQQVESGEIPSIKEVLKEQNLSMPKVEFDSYLLN